MGKKNQELQNFLIYNTYINFSRAKNTIFLNKFIDLNNKNQIPVFVASYVNFSNLLYYIGFCDLRIRFFNNHFLN